jgi:hypothetical protein
MPLVAGGRTIYGHPLGVVMLDTRFPRLLGDVGNAATWPFPVIYRVVPGAEPRRLAQPEPEEVLLDAFIAAARDLERDGVLAITTSCGFLAAYQPQLADAVAVPVYTSPLLQLPLAVQAIRSDQSVAVFTAVAALTDRHFSGAGWSTENMSVFQVAPPTDSHFVETFVGDAPQTRPEILRDEVARLTQRVMSERPDVGAIVLECANFVPFSQTVRGIAHVPVFDLYTLAMHAVLSAKGTAFAAGGGHGTNETFIG